MAKNRIVSLLLSLVFITPLMKVKAIQIPSEPRKGIESDRNLSLRNYEVEQVEELIKVEFEKRKEIELEEQKKREIEEQKIKEEKSKEMLVELSFYTSTYEECSRTDGLTASGVYATPYYTIAMDTSIPFGTLVEIEGFGIMEVQDTGSAIGIYYNEQGEKIYQVDVYLGYDTQKAIELGRYITNAKIIN